MPSFPSPAPGSDCHAPRIAAHLLSALSAPGTGLSLISLGSPCNSMIRYYDARFTEGERGSERASCAQEHQPVKERARRLCPVSRTQTTSPHDAVEPQVQHHQERGVGRGPGSMETTLTFPMPWLQTQEAAAAASSLWLREEPLERWETLTYQEVDSGGRSPVGAAVSGERGPVTEVSPDFSEIGRAHV